MIRQLQAGVLSVRALNQYRRRDVVAYLGLRYYLENTAARSDLWAKRVASGLVLDRPAEPYFQVSHFKEVQRDGSIHHRGITLPGPNEALAEAALLDRCAQHSVFANPPSVFSYALCTGDDRTGMFQHYMKGLRDRHTAVGEACLQAPDAVVRYLDIERFYPSISADLALRAWQRFASEAGLANRDIALGYRLIGAHGTSNSDGSALLTGPMFSHFLANLILRDLDTTAASHSGVKYFRYVDDIVLVGSQSGVQAAANDVTSRLAKIGFAVHDEHSPKSLEVPAQIWLNGRDDFLETEVGRLWKEFVGELKRFLLVRPESRTELQRAFESEGFRIPVRDYSSVVREQDYLVKIGNWAFGGWLRRWHVPTTEKLLASASRLRQASESELAGALETASDLRGFDRKRRVPKLRYHAARLVYLSTDTVLADFSSRLFSIPELYFHARVMHAVATRELDGVLSLGTNAAQAVAQPLRANGSRATLSRSIPGDAEADALAVVMLNGVSVSRSGAATDQHNTPLREFAAHGGTPELMRSRDPFIRELACLHGIGSGPRHSRILESVYDENEAQILDAIEMAHGSVS